MWSPIEGRDDSRDVSSLDVTAGIWTILMTIISTSAQAHPSRAGILLRRKLDLCDYLLFLPSIWLASALGISLRVIGPAFAIVPIGTCLIYAALRKVMPPRLLALYMAYCLIVAVFSALHLMPKSWQVYFMEAAVVRQLVPPLAFFVVAWASKAYFFRNTSPSGLLRRAPTILLLSLLVAPAVMASQGLRYEGDGLERGALALYGAFINNILLAVFFLTFYLFVTTGFQRYASLVAILLICITAPFLQFRILTAIILMVAVGFPGRVVVGAVVALFIAIYALTINHIPEVMHVSSDSALRLRFIADALTSVLDTHGVGIGFGTESVRWVYHFPGMPTFRFLPNANLMSPERLLEALSTGVHNSFVQALLRTGVIGCALLALAFSLAFPRKNLPRSVRNHAAIVFSMIFIACFVNPALESPVQVVGIGFIYGYLLALREASAPEASGAFKFPRFARSAPNELSAIPS